MKSVYIFDDDSDILLMCGIVLRQKGFGVHSSADCNDIVNKVRVALPDIILMDNKIPPEGGIIATRQLLADDSTKHIPVIYFSANTNVEALSKEAGAKFYIQKPFDIDDLESVIENALGAQSAS